MVSEINNKTRFTIGLLFDNLYENYGATIWSGVVEYAKEQDSNVICFSGGALHAPDPFYSQRNVIYDLVSINNVDGLVAISSSIGNYLEKNELDDFYSRYKSLPIVSIGAPIFGCPCIKVDNDYGTHALIEHLIKVHRYSNIAFVGGPKINPEAEIRFRTYRKVLEENGIPFNPEMVAPGTFENQAGAEAIELLFDKRELDIDALFLANDYMALNAIKILQQRGIDVPGKVAVVGFDDIKECSGIIPALTTVHQPLKELGRQAARTLLALLKGKNVSAEIILPTKLIIRRSCGCFALNKIHSLLNYNKDATHKQELDFTGADKNQLRVKIIKVMKSSFINPPAEIYIQNWAMQLCDIAVKCIKAASGEKFLIILEKLLAESNTMHLETSAWYSILSNLFGWITESSRYGEQREWINDLWKEALVATGRTAEQVEFLKRINEDTQARKLNRIGQALIAAFNKNALKKVIIEELPVLGIRSCFIALYTGHKTTRQFSKPFLSYNNHKMLETKALPGRFSSSQLIPGGLKSVQGRFSFLVMPLYFKTEPLGFILFEIGPMKAMVYETLTNQLSSAIKGAELVKNRKQLEMEILETSGREQQRIGQDLHDGLGQILTSVAYLCKVLEDQLRSKELEEVESMTEISGLINQSIAHTRNLARGLFPVELEQNGLISALEELARNTRNQFKIPCRFRCVRNVLINDNSRALHLYRIAQEAVNNAVKHSRANRIDITLSSGNNKVTLSVYDNGIGIKKSVKTRKGMGLRIMKYRANMIGAEFEIKQNKLRGTKVICRYKCTPDKKEKFR